MLTCYQEVAHVTGPAVHSEVASLPGTLSVNHQPALEPSPADSAPPPPPQDPGCPSAPCPAPSLSQVPQSQALTLLLQPGACNPFLIRDMAMDVAGHWLTLLAGLQHRRRGWQSRFLLPARLPRSLQNRFFVKEKKKVLRVKSSGMQLEKSSTFARERLRGFLQASQTPRPAPRKSKGTWLYGALTIPGKFPKS